MSCPCTPVDLTACVELLSEPAMTSARCEEIAGVRSRGPLLKDEEEFSSSNGNESHHAVLQVDEAESHLSLDSAPAIARLRPLVLLLHLLQKGYIHVFREGGARFS